MCGRFVQRYTWDEIRDLYDLPDGPAPNQLAEVNAPPTPPPSTQSPADRSTALSRRSATG